MGQPVVHFEVIGKEPEKLRSFYGGLFDWEFDTNAPVANAVSEAGNYGFVDRYTADDGTGIRGGVGGGREYTRHTIFYVAVPDVEAALEAAERLGGTRVLGPGEEPGKHPCHRTLHRSRRQLDGCRRPGLTRAGRQRGSGPGRSPDRLSRRLGQETVKTLYMWCAIACGGPPFLSDTKHSTT